MAIPTKSPYHTWVPASLYTAAACLVLGVVLYFPLGPENGGIVAVLLGSLALGALITAAVMAHAARRAEGHLAAFRGGSYLAHWRYTDQEWRSFAAAERERATRTARWLPLWGLGAGAVFALAWSDAPWITIVNFLLAGLIVGLAARILYLRHQLRVWGEGQPSGETFIGPEAVALGHRYFAWTGMGSSLAELRLLPGSPAVLEFTVESNAGRSSTRHQWRVPVPAGREAEAEALVQRLAP